MTTAEAPAPVALEAGRRAGLHRAVLGVGRHGALRPLPWRATTRDPWAILVSEVMLQQTQAARVVAYYERFLAQFPTPAACAVAPVGDVVRAFGGLGYNRRAVYLHRAAQRIVGVHGGAVPADLDALRALPGVGEYTARAVLAFAFEYDVGVVDTNVLRVLSRAVAGRALSAGGAQVLADAAVPRGAAWAHNQTMLDLGATQCAARPACVGCPVRRRCAWAAAGWPDPDPARRTDATRASRFAGSDRQGRGRLVAELRARAVGRTELARVAGWPDDEARAERVADRLVADGLARWGEGMLVLA